MLAEVDNGYYIESDKPKTECGIFGLYLHKSQGSNLIVDRALKYALENQHRGEESAGYCISDGYSMWPPETVMGKIQTLYEAYQIKKITRGGTYGHMAIVHNRYSTTGSSTLENAAPFPFDTELGHFAIAHNGNITNAAKLKSELISNGYHFTSTTDSEVIGALIKFSEGRTMQEKIAGALGRLDGAFCLVISTKDSLYAAKDPRGFHPLSIGEFEEGGKKCYAVSSETSGFSKLPVTSVCEINPGELVEITEEGLISYTFAESDEALCGLEGAYLERGDSRFEGVQWNTIRRKWGYVLAQNYPVPDTVDLVTYIPESAKPAAEGYALRVSQERNKYIPMETTMIKGRYGTLNGKRRGFINPDQKERKLFAEDNYYPFDTVIDKEIVVVDDSVIRGTTTREVINKYKRLVGMLKNRGAKKVHLRIVFPPVKSHCEYGVDIGKDDFLVAREFEGNLEKIAEYIGADSLYYLTQEEFEGQINETLGRKVGMCMACVNGKYPTAVNGAHKLIFEEEIA